MTEGSSEKHLLEIKAGAVLYMPDGNKRFAERHNLSLLEAYCRGGRTLRLFSEFFVVEGRSNMLIYHAGSSYTHKRVDSSLGPIYEAGIKTFEELLEEGFFRNNRVSFRAINYSGKLPERLEELAIQLSESVTDKANGEVVVLLGYSLEEDFNQALLRGLKDYKSLRRALAFPDIDLVVRPMEMRPSGGPVYAMSQAQMMILDRLNPEVTREDLERLWEAYQKLKDYRVRSNPHHH